MDKIVFIFNFINQGVRAVNIGAFLGHERFECSCFFGYVANGHGSKVFEHVYIYSLKKRIINAYLLI
jgi:hypothetical protein